MTMATTTRVRRAALALVVALVASVSLTVLPSAPAGAIGNGGWAVEPSGPNGTGTRDYFVYTLSPGQGFQDTVGISNFSDQPLTFKVYARDAFSAGADAGFGVQKRGRATQRRRLVDPARRRRLHRAAGQAGRHPVHHPGTAQRQPG